LTARAGGHDFADHHRTAVADIGRKAVDLLLNKIDNPDAPTERVMMDWRFISRAST
jgi:DNA-binding LacI/PurR family transcriptional regulator